MPFCKGLGAAGAKITHIYHCVQPNEHLDCKQLGHWPIIPQFVGDDVAEPQTTDDGRNGGEHVDYSELYRLLSSQPFAFGKKGHGSRNECLDLAARYLELGHELRHRDLCTMYTIFFGARTGTHPYLCELGLVVVCSVEVDTRYLGDEGDDSDFNLDRPELENKETHLLIPRPAVTWWLL